MKRQVGYLPDAVGFYDNLSAADNLRYTARLGTKFTILSGLAYGDYASHTTEEDYKRALVLIAQMGRCATHIHYLENDQVLELLKRTHVSLLPTYDDTYGFSVLEAQAAGCPVSHDGWLCPAGVQR